MGSSLSQEQNSGLTQNHHFGAIPLPPGAPCVLEAQTDFPRGVSTLAQQPSHVGSPAWTWGAADSARAPRLKSPLLSLINAHQEQRELAFARRCSWPDLLVAFEGLTEHFLRTC